MRWYRIVIGFFVVLALSSAGVYIHVRRGAAPIGTQNLNREIEAALHRLPAELTAKQILDLEEMPQFTGDEPDWLANAEGLPKTADYPAAQLRTLYVYSQSCEASLIADQSTSIAAAHSLAKTISWHRYLCHQLPQPQDDFFAAAPYLHPGGRSFALLAVASGQMPYAAAGWVSAHLDFFHPVEWRELSARGFVLPPAHAVLATLRRAEIAALLRGNRIVFSDIYVLLQQERGERDRGLRYAVFDRQQVDGLFQFAVLQPQKPKVNAVCLKDVPGNAGVCWHLSGGDAPSWILFSVMLTSLVALTMLLAFLALKRARALLLEREAQKTRLGILTHELRTPASGISVHLEAFRHDFDQLSPRLQTAFLNMCNDAQRLERVIAASTEYLHAQNATKTLRVLPKSALVVPSVAALCEHLLRHYAEAGKTLGLDPGSSDISVAMHPYWLELCIKNLIDNAYAHGQTPVTLHWAVRHPYVEISVSDAGNSAPVNLEAMIHGNVSQSAKIGGHQGLGLGLSIVRKIVTDLGGELRYTREPTTLTLKLRS